MLRRQLGIACLSVLVSASAWAAPTTAPLTPEEDKHQSQLQSATEAAKLPMVSIHSPSEVVRLWVTADMICSQWLLKNTPRQIRLALPNPGIIATVQIYPPFRREAGTSHGFFMLLRDFSPPGSLSVWTTVSATDGKVQLAREYESGTISGSTQLMEDAPPMPGQPSSNIDPVRLIVRRTNEATQQNLVNFTFSAPTFVALCRAHPAETEEYLRPIFHDLGEEAAVFAPDPAAVWQALSDDWQPDSGLVKQVTDAVANFDADDFRQRESAGRSLRQLGEPAALTLMHMDRSKFSVAVNSGVDTFLAPYLPLSRDEAKRLGKDRDFLLDSQYCDDSALRKAAAARLANLTGQPLGFDPAADTDTRLAQVRALRNQNSPPATAP
jgi:hypothetical protein